MKHDDEFLMELEQQLAQELAQDELHEYNRLFDEQQLFDELFQQEFNRPVEQEFTPCR